MGTISDKLLYLNETKDELRDGINELVRASYEIDEDDTFRSYVEPLKSIRDRLPRVEGEGENITLDDTIEARMRRNSYGNTKQVQIAGETGTEILNASISVSDVDTSKESYISPYGNTYQPQYTGKNILDCSTLSVDTKNGITCTYDNSTQEIMFNGTCTADNTTFSFYNTSFNGISGSTTMTMYYVSGSFSGNAGLRFVKDDYSGNIISRIDAINGSTPKVSKTANSDGELIHNYFRFDNGNKATNFKMKVMLANTTDDTYEPYVGGAASPSPSYPQQIHTFAGDNNVSVCKKNLLQLPDGTYTGGDKSITISNGTITPNFTTVSSTGSITVPINLSFSANTNYYFNANTNERYPYFTFRSGATNIGGVGFDDYGEKAISVDNDVTADNLVIYFGSTTLTYGVMTPQLEIGTTSTSFEPYDGTTYPINLPVENLCNKDTSNILNAYINSSTGVITTSTVNKLVYFELKPNTTYTMTFDKYDSNGDAVNFNVDDSCYALFDAEPQINSVGINSINATRATNHFDQTFTTDNTHVWVAVKLVHTSKADYDKTIATMQIEYGTKANRYTAYGVAPIKLCKIGTYQDKIVRRGDKWYKYAETGEVVLDGSEEGWGVSNTGTSNWFYRYRSISDLDIDHLNGLSNYFTRVNISSTNTVEGFSLISTNQELRIRFGTEDTINNFKTWLSTHNTEVKYILATPTYTEITDTTLLSQLNALYTATTYETTNIYTVPNDLAPYIDFKYNVITPSPSPDRPSEVHSVSGDNEVVVCGKNLISAFTNNLFVNSSKDYIQTTSNVYGCIGRVKPNTTYTIKRYGGNRFWLLSTSGYPKYQEHINTIFNENLNLTEKTFTTGANDNYIFCYYSNESANVNIQLEEGSTATEYEQYTGNTYPLYLPVKNEVDFATQDYALINSATETHINGTYTITCSNSSQNGAVTFRNLNLKPNTTYTFSALVKSTTASGGSQVAYRSDTTVYGDKVLAGNRAKVTFTTGADASDYWLALYPREINAVATFTDIMLEIGDKANHYTPYGVQPITLNKIGNYQDKFIRNSGKNVLNMKNGTYSNNDIIGVVNDGEITLNGTASANAFVNIPLNNDLGISLNDTITISINNPDTNDNVKFRIDENGMLDTPLSSVNKTKTIDVTYQLYGNAVKIRVASGTTLTNFKIRPMIEYGSTANEYEPYGTNEWYLKKEIGKREYAIADMNNSENYPGWKGTDVIPLYEDLGSRNVGGVLTDYTDYMYNINAQNVGISVNFNAPATPIVYLNRGNYGNDHTKTYWQTNYPNLIITIYYRLYNPTYTKVTDNTLIEQLDATWYSQDGQTNIGQDNNDQPFWLEVDALKDSDIFH